MNIKRISIFLVVLFLIILVTSQVTAMSHFQTVGTNTGLVTASALNIRQGPGAAFKIVTTVYKNEYIRVFAKIGSWYVVQTDNDFVGMASSKYIKLIYPNSSNVQGSTTLSQNNNTSGLTRR